MSRSAESGQRWEQFPARDEWNWQFCALEKNVLAGRVNHESSSLGLPDSHNPKGVGVAVAVGGTEGHKVAPPAVSGFSWSQETVKLQKTEVREEHDRRGA